MFRLHRPDYLSSRRWALCKAAQTCARTPLLDALRVQGNQAVVPFHIPGHKRGAGVLPELLSVVTSNTLRHDLTELPGLDYLADPCGPIAESQALAAETFGADRTWYLVNGTSVGLQAAIMATCNPGDAVLIARNCHSAAFAAMVLADARPIWVAPHQDRRLDVSQGVSPEALEEGFRRAHAQGLAPKAALIVSPTYFGACSDVSGLAAVCHSHDVPLIIDEAHGAHLGLCPGFPASAMQQGADIAVQSTHKTLSSLGQSSMLHSRGGRVSQERISQSLSMLQTTSPSYLLLASLDAAQAQARLLADGRSPALLAAVSACKRMLRSLHGITLLEDGPEGCGVSAYDPWRITVDVQQLSRTGFEVEQMLQDIHMVFPEMATHKVVVFALGPGTLQEDLDALLAAFTTISGTMSSSNSCHRQLTSLGVDLLPMPLSPGLTPRAAFFAAKEMVAFGEAVGRLSGDVLCPYPPGVPVAFPGEELTAASLEHLRAVQQAGGKITGATDSKLQQLLVLKEGWNG